MKLLSRLLPLSGILCLLNTGSVNAASELIDIKSQNFGGLELIRACNILPCDQIDFGIDLCAICNVLPKTPPQEPLVSLASRDMLTLNIYESPYALTGQRAFRAEWSVYVKDLNDPSAKGPYLMVVDLDSSSPSLDPYNLFTPAMGFTYANNAGRLEGAIKYLGQNPSEKFSFAFGMPPADAPSVKLHEPWILANDRIYWRNGVYDMLFYNGLLLDADAGEVDPRSVVINNRTSWSSFIDPTPTRVVVFRNPLQFVLHPWYNVEELDAEGLLPPTSPGKVSKVLIRGAR